MNDDYVKSLEERIEEQEETIKYLHNWRTTHKIRPPFIKVFYYGDIQGNLGYPHSLLFSKTMVRDSGYQYGLLNSIISCIKLNETTIKLIDICCMEYFSTVQESTHVNELWSVSLKKIGKVGSDWSVSKFRILEKNIVPKVKIWNENYIKAIWEEKYKGCTYGPITLTWI